MTKAIVLVSGGMDSCVTTAMAQAEGHTLCLLHLNYGQRTEKRELQAFQELADHYQIPDNRRMVCSIAHLAAMLE